ncbi:MAG: hypothetical protein SVR04_06665 [Spirochaetota bacterium]|nr:hypothetical protein [Spirochaetota bacterium]
MHTFSTNYPRHENSQGEKKSFLYITETLEELGVTAQRTNLDTFDTFHSFSSIIFADFTGPAEGEVYLVFPVNHPDKAGPENSGAAGLALALSLCRDFAASPPQRTVHILFMGAEFGRSEESQLGTRAFLQDYFSNAPGIVLYIDLRSASAPLEFQPYGTGIVSPAWLVRHTAITLLAEGIPYDFNTMEFNIHQLGFNAARTRIDPYLDREIPSLYLMNRSAATAEAAATGADESSPLVGPVEMHSFLKRFISTLPRSFPSQWDRHYLFFKIRDIPLVISEISYVLILLFIFAGVLLYPFFQQKRFYRYLRSIRHNGWVLPIIFSLMFIYLLVSTFLLEGILALKEEPLLWQQQPFLMLLLKLGFTVFLFSLSHRVTAPIHLNRLRGSFYSSAGLLLLLINVIILTSYNLALTVYGAAIFFLGFLFTVVRNRLVKLLYLLLSIILILVLLIQSFRTGSSRMMYGILLSHVRGNLIISFHLLPYMLFFLRLSVLFHQPRRPVVRRISLAFDLVFGLLSAALFLHFTVLYQPNQGRPDRLTITESITSSRITAGETEAEGGPADAEFEGGPNADRTLQTVMISSTSELGGLAFTAWNGSIVRVSGEDSEMKEAKFFFPAERGPVNATVTSRSFLGRATYTVSLDTSYPPDMIEAAFDSSSRINVYDADFPSSHSDDRKRVRFHIGRNPDIPFRMSFTLPEDLEGTLTLRLVYSTPPYALEIAKGEYDIDYTLESITRIDLPPVPVPDQESGSELTSE